MWPWWQTDVGVAQAADTWLSAQSSVCVQPPSAPQALALQPLPSRASQSRSPHSGFQRLRITRKASKDTLPCGQGPQQPLASVLTSLPQWSPCSSLPCGHEVDRAESPFSAPLSLAHWGSHHWVSTAVVLSAHKLAGMNFSAVGLPGEIVSPWRSATSSMASIWHGGWLGGWTDRWVDE